MNCQTELILMTRESFDPIEMAFSKEIVKCNRQQSMPIRLENPVRLGDSSCYGLVCKLMVDFL